MPSTDVVLSNQAAPPDEMEETGLARIAGVVLAAHAVQQSGLSISAQQDVQGNILVRGNLKSGATSLLTLDYIAADAAISNAER